MHFDVRSRKRSRRIRQYWRMTLHTYQGMFSGRARCESQARVLKDFSQHVIKCESAGAHEFGLCSSFSCRMAVDHLTQLSQGGVQKQFSKRSGHPITVGQYATARLRVRCNILEKSGLLSDATFLKKVFRLRVNMPPHALRARAVHHRAMSPQW